MGSRVKMSSSSIDRIIEQELRLSSSREMSHQNERVPWSRMLSEAGPRGRLKSRSLRQLHGPRADTLTSCTSRKRRNRSFE